jgi:hypothetical protein
MAIDPCEKLRQDLLEARHELDRALGELDEMVDAGKLGPGQDRQPIIADRWTKASQRVAAAETALKAAQEAARGCA